MVEAEEMAGLQPVRMVRPRPRAVNATVWLLLLIPLCLYPHAAAATAATNATSELTATPQTDSGLLSSSWPSTFNGLELTEKPNGDTGNSSAELQRQWQSPAATTVATGKQNGQQTINRTTEIETSDTEQVLIIGVILANIIIFIIGLCGNTVVILVILRFTRIGTVTDIYILNLALADLMFIMGLVFLITTMFNGNWIFGNLMCKLYMATTSLNQFASSLLLVVMSFDRYLAVCHPIYAQRFRQLSQAKIICLCIWAICLVLMTPIFAFAKINEGGETCAIFWPDYPAFNCEVAFTLYSFAIGFAVPLLLIAAFYICVIRKLRVTANRPVSMGGTRRSRSRETTNRRIEYLVVVIICTYTICWLPYWITQLSVSFNFKFGAGFYVFILVATSLSYTNSALNPILYAFLSDNFKRRCSDIFRSIYSLKWCRRSGAYKSSKSNNNNNSNHPNATTCCESEVSGRFESRQTIVLQEQSVRLVASPLVLPSNEGANIEVLSSANNDQRNQLSVEEQTDRQQQLLGESNGTTTLDHSGSRPVRKGVAFGINTIVMQGSEAATIGLRRNKCHGV